MTSTSHPVDEHLETRIVDDRRSAVDSRARDEVIEAATLLLGDVHDLDFHHYCDGSDPWLRGRPIEQVAGYVLGLAERLATTAADVRATITAAVSRRDWVAAGLPLWCLACDQPIDPTWDEWHICRGIAEHAWCHQDDPVGEDADRRAMIQDAEHAAYLDERARTGGPRNGDLVRVTYPDGTSQYADWHVSCDGTVRATAHDYHGHRLELPAGVSVEIVELAEDAWTPPPDGTPVLDDLIDVAELRPECGACHQPLTRPAVWARGYRLHSACAEGIGPAPIAREKDGPQ